MYLGRVDRPPAKVAVPATSASDLSYRRREGRKGGDELKRRGEVERVRVIGGVEKSIEK